MNIKFISLKTLVKHLIVASFIVVLMWESGISFCINVSESLPQRFFILKREPADIPSGSYVVFLQTFEGKEQRLIKQVLGKFQDHIQVESDNVWINEQWVGRAKTYSKTGKALNPIKPQRVPQNYFFVAGTHLDSFDSRYQEFGLLSRDRIIARAYPLF